MNCEKCGKEIEYTDLEKKIRTELNVHAPTTCYRCRQEDRNKRKLKYGFEKVVDALDGKEILTSSGFVGRRKITSYENYEKILDELN
jgi:hypothetical protein